MLTWQNRWPRETMEAVSEINLDNRLDELEGFTFLGNAEKGITVTSSRTNNVNLMTTHW